MTREEFNQQLKKANLSKQQFCEIIGLQYGAVNNWGNKAISIPKWVQSWFDNYIKAQDIDKIMDLMQPYLKYKIED